MPWLILGASALLAAQEPLRACLLRRLAGRRGRGPTARRTDASERSSRRCSCSAGPIYGGYFGAGLGVIVLAVLGLVLHDSLTRLNASKQAIGFAANLAAALLFAVVGPVHWPAAAVMAVGAIAGGVDRRPLRRAASARARSGPWSSRPARSSASIYLLRG